MLHVSFAQLLSLGIKFTLKANDADTLQKITKQTSYLYVYATYSMFLFSDKTITALKAGTENKGKYGVPMLNLTRDMLRTFFAPYNKMLADLTGNNDFLFDTAV